MWARMAMRVAMSKMISQLQADTSEMHMRRIEVDSTVRSCVYKYHARMETIGVSTLSESTSVGKERLFYCRSNVAAVAGVVVADIVSLLSDIRLPFASIPLSLS